MQADTALHCVLLANRHQGLAEGVRGLLATMFETVVMVADAASLLECAGRLRPEAVVADLSIARDGGLDWLRRLRRANPETKVVAVSFHEEPAVQRAAREAGCDGFVLTRAIATDLLPTLESVLARSGGEAYRPHDA